MSEVTEPGAALSPFVRRGLRLREGLGGFSGVVCGVVVLLSTLPETGWGVSARRRRLLLVFEGESSTSCGKEGVFCPDLEEPLSRWLPGDVSFTLGYPFVEGSISPTLRVAV